LKKRKREKRTDEHNHLQPVTPKGHSHNHKIMRWKEAHQSVFDEGVFED
jgi:hypothetical protein